MYMHKLLKIITKYIPKTEHLIIIFSNVISFMTLQTCFFWYVASFKIENIIDNKSKFVRDILYTFPETLILLDNYTRSDSFLELKQNATDHRNKRYEYNINLLVEWMTPPFACMILLLVGCIIECYVHHKKFDKTDKIILSMVLVSVFTEVIFYFVVIFRSEILADVEIVEIALDNFGVRLTDEEILGMFGTYLNNSVNLYT